VRQKFFKKHQLQFTVETREYHVHSRDGVQQAHDAFVAEGYEGAIVRAMNAEYKYGYRSSGLLKVKAFQDAEFTIVGWTAGKGKFQEVPIFRCRTEAGKEFDVVPQGSNMERSTMLAAAHTLVGKQLTVKFFDWTDDGLPQFPVGICIREAGA
jgi:DNA ligase-1